MRLDEERRLLNLGGPDRRAQRIRNWLLHPDVIRLTVRRVWPSAPEWLPPARSHPIGLRPGSVIPRPPPTEGPIDAQGANLRELVRILEGADIEFFMVPDRTPTRYQLGVRDEDRSRLLRALESGMVPGGMLCGAPSTDLIRFQQSPRRRPIGPYRRAQLMNAPTWYYLRYQAVPGAGSRLLGMRHAVVISFWRDKRPAPGDGHRARPWISATPNGVTTELSAENREPASVTVDGRDLPSIGPFTQPLLEAHDFPIDLVCMWVDGDDPEWIQRRNRRRAALRGETPSDTDAALAAHLYRSRDELRYALRSVAMYAPFFRKIFLVTDDQRPEWLNEDDDRLEVISHRDILDPEHLPTFNSNAIDTGLHRIPGLAEHYVYTNDDIMFCAPIGPEHFFTPGGIPHVFLSQAQIPMGEPVQGEPAVDSVEKNVRSAIRRSTGRLITQKHKHIPNAQRVSIRAEVESKFRHDIDTTARHPFRDLEDLNPSHLANYYALATGRAVTETLPYRYINMADPKLEGALAEASATLGATMIICFNDADEFVVTDAYGDRITTFRPDLEQRDRMVVDFCRRAWPHPSGFEKPGT